MKRRLSIAVLLLLVLATSAGASWWDKLVEALMEHLIPWVVKLILYPFMTLSLFSLKGLLYFNPTVLCYGQPGCKVTPGIGALRPYIMDILLPFYVVALMFVALFLITKSGSPRGRSKAKRMFFRLIIGMLFVIYAPFIFQAMIDVSEALTKVFLDKVDINKVTAVTSFGKAVSMVYLQFCMCLVTFITSLILLVRWFYVYIYGVFFPLIMFLYFFEITQPYGSKYFKQAIRWIFVPPLQALILYILVNGPLMAMGAVRVSGLGAADLQAIFTQFIGVFVVLSGMTGVCVAPMMMTHILTFMGKLIYSFGLVVNNLPLMSIGGVVAGEGPSAFTTAHATFSRLRAYEASQSSAFGGSIAKEAPKAMRMAGGQRGALDGHGGVEGGGGGEYGGGGFFGGAAAARRGMPGMPSMESEMTKVRTSATPSMGRGGGGGGTGEGEVRETAREESGEEVSERTEKTAGRTQASLGETETAQVPSELDIGMAREEAATGLNPEDIKQEREEVKGREGESPYELLQGRETLLTAFSAMPGSQSRMIGGVSNSIDILASAGVAPGDLKPFRSMLSDMKSIHRITTITKKPDEVREGDLTVKSDLAERQKSLENNAAESRGKMAVLQKQHYEKEAVRNEIAYLQRMLGHAAESKEKKKENRDKGT